MGCTHSKATEVAVIGKPLQDREIPNPSSPVANSAVPVEQVKPTSSRSCSSTEGNEKTETSNVDASEAAKEEAAKGPKDAAKSLTIDTSSAAEGKKGSQLICEEVVVDDSATSPKMEVILSPTAKLIDAPSDDSFGKPVASPCEKKQVKATQSSKQLESPTNSPQDMASSSEADEGPKQQFPSVEAVLQPVVSKKKVSSPKPEKEPSVETVLQPVVSKKAVNLKKEQIPVQTAKEPAPEAKDEEVKQAPEVREEAAKQLAAPQVSAENPNGQSAANAEIPSDNKHEESQAEVEPTAQSEAKAHQAADDKQEDQQATAPECKKCAGCGAAETAPATFKFCAKCRTVTYCSRNCQKKHWKEHKKTCCKEDPASKSNIQESSNLQGSANLQDHSKSFTTEDVKPLENAESASEEAIREFEAALENARRGSEDREDFEIKAEEETAAPSDKHEEPEEGEVEEHIAAPLAEESTTPKDEEVVDEDPVDAARQQALDVDENVAPATEKTTPKKEEVPVMKIVELRMCAGCNRLEETHSSFKFCARCHQVVYCHRKCQKSHWKEHKKVCCKAASPKSEPTEEKALNPIQVA
jgi:hypothetical protein